MAPEPIPTLLLKYSPWKRFVIVMAVFAIGAGYFVMTRLPGMNTKALLTGWALTVLCGLIVGAVVFLALSFNRGTAIEISERGIHNHRARWPLIGWEGIRCVTVRYMTLEIHPKDPASVGPLPFDGHTVDVDLQGVSPGEAHVAQYLRRYFPKKLQKS